MLQYDTGTVLLPIKMHAFLFCLHRNEWENVILFKLHRKPQQTASCLHLPFSPFHYVITSLSWKCGRSSTLLTYYFYVDGHISSYF